MQDIFKDIRSRLPKLRSVETRVSTPGGEVFLEHRTNGGGFTSIQNPEPRTRNCQGFVYDFKPDLQMAELIPGLFLGSQDVASELELLKSKGVTHIINAASGIKNHFPDDFKYKRVEVLDIPEQEMRSHFEHCNSFIDEALASGGAVFVHCNAGVSRSTTICIAYLISRKGMDLDRALRHTRSIRPIARPNEGFMTQLRAYQSDTIGPAS
ncbi:dual specificity protein phosphatase 1B [Galendromus occidentalis]|uniref:protein-serine/threonine phosphatase n=1 Tax=Galendromus occidentalis TaxID=34638 RepID=A0AAJ7L3S0_9ACAR|nr:dual specificity protein phosphatase 1B [Galendromus occidentalis]